tara:strand:- start:69 stop:227 length:159 start_codon:yes stop_codon:yes gene_type:complete
MTKKKIESSSLLFAVASRIAAKNKKNTNVPDSSSKKNKPSLKPRESPKSQKQ